MFGDKVFQVVIQVKWIVSVGPNTIRWCPYKKRNLRHKHRNRGITIEGTARMWSFVNQRERKNQIHQHLHLGCLASRAVLNTFLLFTPSVYGIFYSSPIKLIQKPYTKEYIWLQFYGILEQAKIFYSKKKFMTIVASEQWARSVTNCKETWQKFLGWW